MIDRIGENNALVAQRVMNYEDRLAQDKGWGLNEAGKIFEGRSEVQKTMRKIADSLTKLGIDYTVVGGMALFQHGFRRFTEDVDLLVTPEGLKELHQQLRGRGYLPPFEGSKNLRDTENGVKIEFLVVGGYPGDGKPKPVSFPTPSDVSEEVEGVRYVKLSTLVELKLASGMTNRDRAKDLIDIEELIKTLNLPKDFGESLNPYVRDKYIELWNVTRSVEKRYVLIWRNKFATMDAKTLGEMVSALRESANTLQQMLNDGVTLDPDGGTSDDYAHLVTTDPDVARKYGMHDESEFMDRD
ncbi:MAG: nucleotidyl transferase AbiEii/AbiGii toxin family protein [Planctomycetaceae bacterium]